MSLYDEFLAFEEKYARLKTPTLYTQVYAIRITDELRELNKCKTKLSSKRYKMDEQAFIDTIMCYYKISRVYKKYGINIPKINYPPLVQKYVEVREIMDS